MVLRIEKKALFSFFFPLLVYILTITSVRSDGVDSSIVAMQYSLLSAGSASIGNQGSITGTIDYGIFNGRAYSAVAPGFAIISLPFVFLASILKNLSISTIWFADNIFVAFCSALAVLFIYLTSRLYTNSNNALLISLIAAFSTPLWPFSTVVFEHSLSLMLFTVSLFLMLSMNQSSNRKRTALSGLFLGMSSFTEYVSTLFSLPLFLYAYKKDRNASFIFILFFLLGPALNLGYNYSQFGNPFIFPEQLKQSGFSSLGVFSSFDLISMPVHAFLYVFGPYRGLLYYSPVFIVALISSYQSISLKKKINETALLLSVFLVCLLFYSAWKDWEGGLSYGPRFMIISVPFLIVLSWQLERSSLFSLLVTASGTYGALIQGAGALTSAFSVYASEDTFLALKYNIPQLLSLNITSIWTEGSFLLKAVLALTALSSVILAILLAYFSSRRAQTLTTV